MPRERTFNDYSQGDRDPDLDRAFARLRIEPLIVQFDIRRHRWLEPHVRQDLVLDCVNRLRKGGNMPVVGEHGISLRRQIDMLHSRRLLQCFDTGKIAEVS
jgi:hypothetical protein